MGEIEQLQAIIQDQTRLLIEKNRRLAELEYRLKEMIVTGSRREDLARLQAQLNKDTIEGQSSLFRSLLETVPCGILIFNAKRIVVTCNPRALKLLETSEEEIVGKQDSLFLAPCKEEIDQALDQGKTKQIKCVSFSRKTGGEILLSLHISPILNSREGLLGGIVLLSESSADPTKILREEELPEENVVPHGS